MQTKQDRKPEERDGTQKGQGRRKGRRQGVQGAPAFFYILYFSTHLFYHTYSSPSTRTRKTLALSRVFRVLWLRSPPFHPNTKNATRRSRFRVWGPSLHPLPSRPQTCKRDPSVTFSCLGVPPPSTIHLPDIHLTQTRKSRPLGRDLRVWGIPPYQATQYL